MDQAEVTAPAIAIHGRIYALPDLWDGKDDWTGVTSTAERKRRQNRMNQRAYRECLPSPRVPMSLTIFAGRRKKTKGGLDCSHYDVSPVLETPPALECKVDPASRDTSPQVSDIDYVVERRELHEDHGPLMQATPQRVARIRTLIKQAYEDHMLGAPRVESLHVLIRLNALNALARNAMRMGFPVEGLCHDDYVSPFNAHGPHPPGLVVGAAFPQALQPTTLQKTFLHHPWTDLFPFPQFRDNMLRGMEAGLFDEDELCADILEVNRNDLEQRPSLMVWGESWDAMAWEASPAFLRKWGWLLRGCPEIFEGTNYWRERRGERKLPTITWVS